MNDGTIWHRNGLILPFFRGFLYLNKISLILNFKLHLLMFLLLSTYGNYLIHISFTRGKLSLAFMMILICYLETSLNILTFNIFNLLHLTLNLLVAVNWRIRKSIDWSFLRIFNLQFSNNLASILIFSYYRCFSTDYFKYFLLMKLFRFRNCFLFNTDLLFFESFIKLRLRMFRRWGTNPQVLLNIILIPVEFFDYLLCTLCPLRWDYLTWSLWSWDCILRGFFHEQTQLIFDQS